MQGILPLIVQQSLFRELFFLNDVYRDSKPYKNLD